MPSRNGIMFSAALFSLALVCHAAIGANSDDDRTATHAIAFDANGDNNASLSDFDGDGTVGFPDFVSFAGVFGSSEGDEKYDAKYDLNGDGEIGFSDFVIFAQNFGKEVPSPVVAIPDANLRAAIEAALRKARGAPITEADMASLTGLRAPNKEIRDLTGLEYATSMTFLNLAGNNVADVSVLEGLTNLTDLTLSGNNISDLAPLVANTGLGKGGTVDVTNNPLNAGSESTHIPALRARGVNVSFDDVIAITEPQIYNDNVFVLPVAENLAALWTDSGNQPPLEDYAARFYGHFSDEFDFLIFFANVRRETQLEPGSLDGGFFSHVKNDVRGIGLSLFSNNSTWGSEGKLQGVIFFSVYEPFHLGYSDFRGGTLLHELMHRWAAFLGEPLSDGHWNGKSNIRGSLGGVFRSDFEEIVDLGGGRYTGAKDPIDPKENPYPPLELYLAGFVPPEEVPDVWVAVDGEWLFGEAGNLVRDGNGDRIFSAREIKKYTIDDIIAEHGPRAPDHLQSQKDFRAAVILLVSEDYPATRDILESVSDDALWFSHAGEDDLEKSDWLLWNFYEATGGRGTITMDGLSLFKRSAGAKKAISSSFGTPPPPIVDHWEIGNGREDLEGTPRHIPAEEEQP